MIKTNHIEINSIGDGYIKLCYSRRSNTTLKEHIKDINLNDYYIYKATNSFRLSTQEEFLKFKYSGYILFHKSKYNTSDINNSIELLRKVDNKYFKFLDKPFPPIEIMNKIKIINL